jgi:hypothetical protein
MQSMLVITRYTSRMPTLALQHVSAGPQPIFGLAGGLCGLGADLMEHAGPPRPWSGAMKCRQNKDRMNNTIGVRYDLTKV